MEDEWQRQIESDEDLDLLFVTFRPQRVSLEKLLATVGERGYEVTVVPE